jgi:DUF4097 and DUF4098 domain-containing protein YvlB
MLRHRNLWTLTLLLATVVALAGCSAGPSVSGAFDRNYTVSGPIRLELTNSSGDVDIAGSADSKVHVHGEVHASGFGFGSPQKRLDETVSHPPIEQRGDTFRVGKEMSHLRNLKITYTIQVPHDTEVETAVASGAQTIRNVRGPVKIQAASGFIRVEKIDRDAQLTTVSGTISASDMGDDVRVSTASGSVSLSNIKGDVRVNALAGVIQVSKPGDRVEADTASGSVEIQGAAHDVKAHAMSGRVSVQGNPGAESYWELKTASGNVQLSVPASANFHLSADAVSGEIRTDIPIMIEEQGKHALRARIGIGGSRVEVHTVSGEISISSGK